MEVRDPIHGAMRLSRRELAVVDHPFVQRLRSIRQTGFSHLPFPGATHSRYAHSLGAMHLAGRVFEVVYRDWRLSTPAVRRRFKDALRLAALCHDLGHSPFSHCTEFAMPPVARLQLEGLVPGLADSGRRATHEDYTLAILCRSDLAALIQERTACTARHVAALVSTEVTLEDDFFVDEGLDHRRLLSQIISSELDVDRLDYLVRDSYYTGAQYGTVDVPWLVSNLRPFPVGEEVALALHARAIYAFDDFMIARHHMFLMVYFHHKSVVYEELLKRHVTRPEASWSIPSELEAYLQVDDISLEAHLRQARCPWARRIVARRPFRRVLERHGAPADVDLSAEAALLEEGGLEVIGAGSTGTLSRYNVFGQKREKAPQLYVVSDETDPSRPASSAIAEATAVFQRYADARRIARLYVAPEDLDRARELLASSSLARAAPKR